MEFNEIDVLRIQVNVLAGRLSNAEKENAKLTAMLQIKADESIAPKDKKPGKAK